MNRNRIGIYYLTYMINCLNISKEFALIRLEKNVHWYIGSFSDINKKGRGNIWISAADAKYMVRLGLIFKVGKDRYQFRYKETLAHYEKQKRLDEQNTQHWYNQRKGFFYPKRQGDKTRPIITNYRYTKSKQKRYFDILEKARNTFDDEGTRQEFIPPKVKIRTKPWAYNRQKVQRELQKDFFS